MKNLILTLTAILLLNSCTSVQESVLPVPEAQDIVLPEPDKKGGKPLMQALNERQSIRTFKSEDLSLQQLSNLLWAANGINRPSEKKTTAPTSMNLKEIDIYVALQRGVYLYNNEAHYLKLINNKDIRNITGTQSFVGDAAVNLVYVADMGKRGKAEGAEITDSDLLSPYADAGFVAQNVYLYCASENLGTVVRGLVPRDILATELELRSNQRIILAQTVGNIP